jgi:DNA ligase 4
VAFTSWTPFSIVKKAENRLRKSALRGLTPQIGVMITRPPHEKARSINHCGQLAGQRHMSVERKYDGEYCQVHVDLSKGKDCIKIFSKSGKNSTYDRIGLHGALRDSLGLEHDDCKIKRQCVLEGELLVWNDQDEQIEPFHKIRKHVKRSGRFLGTARDSPVDSNEHLMIMFYDILLLDENVCIRETHDERRRRLQSLVGCIPGRADIGSREIIDFSSPHATELLSEAFARAITRRWEGFVLKGCDDPYFSFNNASQHIKLKKDYIPGLGDTADFAIIGGRRDAKDEQEIGMGKLWWTTFYIGCLENKDEVYRFDVKPKFRIIDMVDRHGISKENLRFLNRLGYFEQVPFASFSLELDVKLDRGRLLQPTELFKRPFIVELMGAGFDKPSNAGHFAPRFPRVQKVHQNRTFKDSVSFDELQELARQSNEVPQDSESEERHWLERVRRADPRSDCLLDTSMSSTACDNLDGISSARTTRAGKPESSDGRSIRERRKRKTSIGSSPSDNTSIRSLKRKLSGSFHTEIRQTSK